MDEARFDRVYRAHAPSIVRYCTFSAGSRHDGEDIAADVFARFITRGERLAEEDAGRWLFVVARNLCASHHRAARRRDGLTTQLAENELRTSADAWSGPDTWLYVRSLQERARLVVYLHAVEGRPFTDIARLLGKSTSAVKMTYYRALERLRRDMARDGVGVPVSLNGGASDA